MKKFILYGFSQEQILKIQNTVKFITKNIKYITIKDDDYDKTLSEVISNENFEFSDFFKSTDKILIFDNIVSKEIDIYLKLLRKKIDKKIIFATTTENSLTMKIKDLFDEFRQEREYFSKK